MSERPQQKAQPVAPTPDAPYTVRDLLMALIDLPPSYDGHSKNDAYVQVTADGETFFAIDTIDEWSDGGIVLNVVPWPT